MPKLASPVPPLIAAQALHNLYREARGIPKWPEQISEAPYIESLTQALIEDKVIGLEGNNKFTNNLRSKPQESSPERAPGIDTTRLDKIARIVIDHFNLRKFFNLHHEIKYPWHTFSNIIFPTPHHLAYLNEKKYSKFLTLEERQIIESHLSRKYNELGLIKSPTVNYCLYLWNDDVKEVFCAIIVINPVNKTASYSFYTKDGTGWSPRTVMKSTNFQHGGATLFIDLVEEDEQKPYVKANLFLSLLDVQFTNLPIIKGILISSGNNATAPLSFEVVLEKCGSFFEAYSKAIEPAKRNPLLCLEVIKKRLDINSTNIFAENKLKSYPLYKLLEELNGYYQIAYVTQDGAHHGPGKLSSGLCYIGLDGIILIQMNNSKGILKAYIDQQVYRGDKFLCINYFLSQASDEYDMQYRLEVERDHKNGGIVKYLYGCFSGFIRGTIYKGDISFLKLKGDMFKKDGSFMDFAGALEISPLSAPKDLDKDKLTEIEAEQYGVLKKKKYDH